MNGLTPAQREQLLQPLHHGRVSKEGGRSHLEAYDVRRWLTRIFGHTGWSFTVLETELVYSRVDQAVNPQGFADGKPRATAVYRITGRLTIRDQAGVELGYWDDCATGDGVNMPSVGDAHDFAIKTAASQTLKRCAVNLGDQFGLSLYAKGSLEAMVVRTMVPEAGETAAAGPSALVDLHDAPVVREEMPYETAQPADDQPGRLPDEHWQTPAAAPFATPTKLTRIRMLLMQKRQIIDRDARLAALAAMVGHGLESSKQLLDTEAADVIARLAKEPDPVGGARAAASGDSAAAHELLLRTLHQSIDAATGPAELDQAGIDIGDEYAQANISAPERDELRDHWTAVRNARAEAARSNELVTAS